MRAATLPRSTAGTERLLHVDPVRNAFAHHCVADLPALLRPGDLLVVNDAATLPASFRAASSDIELRLARRGSSDAEWTAVLLGSGDFRVPTEQRPPPPRLAIGERLDLGDGLVAEIIAVDSELPRFVEIRFTSDGAPLWNALYRRARPIQYAYLERELALWHFQNRYAARPWALELPSAGHCLTWDLLLALRARSVRVTHLTHAAGISSTGLAALDARLPLPERYELGPDAAAAIRTTRERGGRVVAVGTTVVRALEANHLEHGELVPGEGEAHLVIGAGFRPRVTDGILSGMHDGTTSHFSLLRAFAEGALLERSLQAAERADYLQHEFGDTMLVLSS